MKHLVRLLLTLAAVASAGCVSVVQQSADAPLAPTKAYVARFFAKHSWKSFEGCTVRSADEPKDGASCELIKRGDELISAVPPGRRKLFLDVITSSESMFRSVGTAKFALTAELKPGVMYAVSLARAGDQVEICIVERAGGAVVSEKLVFDVRHPVIVPIIIPI